MQAEQAKTIAKLVKEKRVQKKLTQQQLAEQTGLSLRSIQRLEKAEGSSRLYTLDMVCKLLELEKDFRELLSDAPVSQPAENTLRPTLSRSQKMVVSIGAALLIALLSLAFVFQSPTFPETLFETVILITVDMLIYIVILLFAWR